MTTPTIYLYAEYQVSIPFDAIDWRSVDGEMKKFPGLLSKTWLSGLNTQTVSGFYAFDSLDNAQHYIDRLLVPFADQIKGNLSVRLYDALATREASAAIHSPFFPQK